MLIKFLQKKWLVLGLIILPGLIFFPLPFINGREGAKLWGKELKYSGFISLALLVATLAITPLIKNFPSANFLKELRQHKRIFGLSLFAYVCLHFSAFLLKVYAKKGMIPLKAFWHPVVIPGLIAWGLMIPLALTSTNRAVQSLGNHRWKQVHKLFYVSELLVFIHLILQEGKPLIWALLLFTPLFLLQWLRIRKKI